MENRVEVTIKVTLDGSESTTIRGDILDGNFNLALGILIADCTESCGIPASVYNILAQAVFCADDETMFEEFGKNEDLNELADFYNKALSAFVDDAKRVNKAKEEYRKRLDELVTLVTTE